jgi:iron complex outermembrane receptor protein
MWTEFRGRTCFLVTMALCVSLPQQVFSQDPDEPVEAPEAISSEESQEPTLAPEDNTLDTADEAETVPPVIVEQEVESAPSDAVVPVESTASSEPAPQPSAPPTRAPSTPPSPAPYRGPTPAPAVDAVPPLEDLLPLPDAVMPDVNSFVPTTTATEREFVEDGGATLTDTLQLKPGISGSAFAHGADRPSIRGLDRYRIRIQEDGIGTHDVSALSEDHAVPIDPLSVDRVEVIRGPATLRYGSTAIGGVVKAENNRIPDSIPAGGFSARTLGGLTSVDDGWDGAFEATGGAGRFAVHADGFKRDANDYNTPQGTEFNSFVESQGGSAGASIVGNNGFIGVSFNRFESLYGIPGEEALEERPRIDLEQDKVLSKGEWRTDGSAIETLRFWFGASDYAHNELVFEEGEKEVGQRFTNRQSEARSEADHAPVSTSLGVLNGSLGVQYNNRRITGRSFEGDSLIDPAASTEMIGFFLYEELELSPQLRLMGSARYENADLAGTGLVLTSVNTGVDVRNSPTFDPFSVSGGLLYEMRNDIVFTVTGHHAERAPADGELYSRGVHEATGTFEIGDPFLSVEEANTIEVGFARSDGPFRFDTAAFYTRFDDFIFRQLTGIGCGETLASCGEEDELDQVVFGQRGATFYGAELAAEHDIAPIWQGVWGVAGQFDFVRAEFTNGENVPRQPPPRLGGGVYYRDAHWVGQLSALHAFRQAFPGVNETETAGYTLLNAELSYTRQKDTSRFFPEVTIGVRGSNLLDDDVRFSTSFKKDEVLQPGASVRLFGVLKLN